MSKDMLGSALAQVAGPLEDFAQKLSGSDGLSWLEAFKRFLRKEEPWPAFPIWRTITLGHHRSVKALQKAIEGADRRVSNWARDIMSQPAFTLANEETEINLVRLTVRELGLPNGAMLKEIFARAKELGFRLCPAEAGPVLCKEYMDQPHSEWLIIAMEPISDSDGYPCLFVVLHDVSGRWLAVWGAPESVGFPGSEFVFAGS